MTTAVGPVPMSQPALPIRRPRAAGRRLYKRIPLYLLAAGFAVLTALPFTFMVLAALKTRGEFLDNPFGLPQEATLANLSGLLTPEFGRYFLNSVVVTLVTVAATVGLGSMAAYPLARVSFRLSNAVLLLFLVGLMVPIHVTLIPIYSLTQSLGIYDTLGALFGPFIAFSLPLTVYVLVQFFRQVPDSLLEAAEMDGAGPWRTFWSVLLPLSVPALSTVAIITFIFVWNEFIFGLILLSSPSNFVLPLGLQQFSGNFSVDVPGVMAALTLASLPTILFFLAAQERVVKGLAAGALAGQ
jgi:raffinose/stachyose/melibiose transport system permease protein